VLLSLSGLIDFLKIRKPKITHFFRL